MCLLITCTGGEYYRYMAGMSLYLNRVHNIDLFTSGDVIFYFLPLEGCTPCITQNIAMLTSIKTPDNLCIVTIGNEAALNPRLSICRRDTTSQIFHYETGFGKPLLLHFIDGRLEKYIFVNDPDIEKAKDYLLSIAGKGG